MRFLAGGQSASTLRNRIFVVFVLIFFLYAYHSQQITYSAIISSQENVLESCEQQSAGLKARLKLIWDHKQMVEKKLEKMEQKSLRDEETSRKLREEIVPNLRTAATNCGVKLDDCQKSLNECQIRPAVPKEHVENDASIREELMKLKKEMDDLKKSLNETTAELDKQKEQAKIFEAELVTCQDKLKAFAGAVGVPKYTQNETASFQRKHKAHDPLSFDRGNIQLQAPSRILSGQELVAKLKEEEEERRKKAEEKEQLEVHPQERDQKDDYVNEVANKEEKDYKEFD